MKKIFKNIVVKILMWEAKMVIRRYKPRIVAITGSVGKTSTKDALYVVLSRFFIVRKSEKSFNSEIGLPLTVLGVPNAWNNLFLWIENIIKGFFLIIWKQKYPEVLVLELGVGKPGDMKNVASWLRPHVVVLTRFPDIPVHVEFFKNTEEIIEEKTTLAHALREDGILVLNHDDKAVLAVHHKVKRKTVSYGLEDNSTFQAIYPKVTQEVDENKEISRGINFKIAYNGNTFPVSMDHVVGTNHIYSGLASVATAVEMGCDILLSIEALAQYKNPPGRLSLIEGLNDSVIIDDSYNSSPVAMDTALDLLHSLHADRRIAVLGDMLELGKMTEEAHRVVGTKVASIANIIVLVGPRAKFIGDGALDAGFAQKELYIFESSITAGKFLEAMIEEGDVILIKGSQGVRMERTVKMIMKNPKDAPKLLCRQEKEWQKR